LKRSTHPPLIAAEHRAFLFFEQISSAHGAAPRRDRFAKLILLCASERRFAPSGAIFLGTRPHRFQARKLSRRHIK